VKIAVVGLGGIGSTFAFRLARAGHEVTAVARGRRLEQLERDRAIVTDGGERATVAPAAALDPEIAWDLVLVTVLEHQVDAVLPALTASAAKTVMFVFNTFEPLDRLRAAVGPARFAFGFPAILARVDGGVLASEVVTRGMVTTVTDARWAEVFGQAGIPATVHPDMVSWLRTHAAMVVPFMIMAGRSYARQAGISWAEATELARAMREGFALVRTLGNAITPAPMVPLSRLPTAVAAGLLWSASRAGGKLRQSGAAGMDEPRALIDAMVAAAPGPLPALAAIRPPE